MTIEKQKMNIAYSPSPRPATRNLQPATRSVSLLDSDLMIDLGMEIWRNKVSGKCFIYLGETGEDEGLFVTPLGEIKSLEKVFFVEVIDEDKAPVTEVQARRFEEYREKRRVYIASRIVDMIAEMEPYDLDEFVRRIKEKEDRQRRFNQEDDNAT